MFTFVAKIYKNSHELEMNGIGEKGSGKSKREEVCRLGVGSGGKADQIKPCRSSRGCWLSL